MDDALELSSAFDYLFKIIIIGDSSTGKSTLLHHFIHHEFVAKSHTVGVEFTSRVLLLGPPSPNPGAYEGNSFAASGSSSSHHNRHLSSGQSRKASAVKLQIWDSAGQERFRSVTRSYYRGAAGCLLVYDVTKRSTYESLHKWLADVRSLAAENLMVVLVGNKTDLVEEEDAQARDPAAAGAGARGGTSTPPESSRKRQVTWDEARQWARENGLLFVETSSLTGHNIESPFTLCARGILELIEQGLASPDEPGSGISYGDRGPDGSKAGSSVTESIVGGGLSRFSFADVVRSGGGVSRGTARGVQGSANAGLIKVKDVLTLKSKEDGGCC